VYGYVLLTDTMIWDELEPWQATYWKTLPHAYHLHCRIQAQAGPFQFHSYRSPSGWDGWTWYLRWWQGLAWDPAWVNM
jgi:hypothetical protein